MRLIRLPLSRKQAKNPNAHSRKDAVLLSGGKYPVESAEDFSMNQFFIFTGGGSSLRGKRSGLFAAKYTIDAITADACIRSAGTTWS